MYVDLEPLMTNFNKVSVGNLTIWFSYRTPIAFNHKGNLYISKNVWSNTTGKHLNWVQRDKSIRIDYEKFQEQLNKHLNNL